MDELKNEILKETAKEIYNDAGKPITKPTGEVLGLVPRAIKAALLPVEKWIVGREYNLEETKKLLEIKLQKISPDLIEAPEPYIAVPTIQYISYCMDSEELRNMYANLLANSMNKVVKNEVHPGFIEIIKQLSPDEAKILNGIYKAKHSIPTIDIRYVNDKSEGITVLSNFSNIGEISKCEYPFECARYLGNLERLGLIRFAGSMSSLVNKNQYIPLKNHIYVKTFENIPLDYKNIGLNKLEFEEGYFDITAFGKKFCEICMDK